MNSSGYALRKDFGWCSRPIWCGCRQTDRALGMNQRAAISDDRPHRASSARTPLYPLADDTGYRQLRMTTGGIARNPKKIQIDQIKESPLHRTELFGRRHQPVQIARDHIDLDIDAVAHPELPERGDIHGMGNDVDIETAAFDLVDGQAHAVQAYRTLRRHEAHKGHRQFELQAPRPRILRERAQDAHRIDMSAH